MGPTWVMSAPAGPHFGPMIIAFRGASWARYGWAIVGLCYEYHCKISNITVYILVRFEFKLLFPGIRFVTHVCFSNVLHLSMSWVYNFIICSGDNTIGPYWINIDPYNGLLPSYNTLLPSLMPRFHDATDPQYLSIGCVVHVILLCRIAWI